MIDGVRRECESNPDVACLKRALLPGNSIELPVGKTTELPVGKPTELLVGRSSVGKFVVAKLDRNSPIPSVIKPAGRKEGWIVEANSAEGDDDGRSDGRTDERIEERSGTAASEEA